MKNVLFNCAELGAGTRGASLGPDAVYLAAARKNPSLFARAHVSRLDLHHDPLLARTPSPRARYLPEIARWADALAHQVRHQLQDPEPLRVFSGDHAHAAGLYSGFWEAHHHQHKGLLWIDAHADLHTPYTSPSGNVHGMPIAALLGLTDEGGARHQPDEADQKAWKHWLACGPSRKMGKLLPSELAFVGLRSVEPEEQFLLDYLRIPYYTSNQVQERGIGAIMDELEAHFQHTEALYVSFDVDVLDPSLSQGTGTPVPHGLSLHEAAPLLTHFGRDPRCRLLEFTEINPLLDTENKMAETVTTLLEELEHVAVHS